MIRRRAPIKRTAMLVVIAGLVGCHRQAADSASVTAEEQAQLNDTAAAMDATGDQPDPSNDNSDKARS